ncbi:MAG: DUF3347 domain-containing protein [Flavisolibacter sp.]
MIRLMALFLLGLLAGCKDEKKTTNEASTVNSLYSMEMNQDLKGLLDSYYQLSELLVKWDSTALDSATAGLKMKVDRLSERMDTATGALKMRLSAGNQHFTEVRNATLEISRQQDITARRHSFHILSENLFRFLDTAGYDQAKIYLHECTMPFNDTGRGVWLSRTEEKRNPYLGLHHPYYKAGMLECGTLEGKIDQVKEN